MAEIVVNPITNDLIYGVSARQIKQKHCERICNYRQATFAHGVRAAGLAQDYLELTSEYKFERVSQTEVLRNGIELFGPTPNELGEYIHVQAYVDHSRSGESCRLFGTPGREVWYGGKRNFSSSALAAAWNLIETATPLRERDHRQAGWTDTELTRFLAVTVSDDADDATIGALFRPIMATRISPVDGLPEEYVKTRYPNMVDWRRLRGLSQAAIAQIEKRKTRTDGRGSNSYSLLELVQAKAL